MTSRRPSRPARPTTRTGEAGRARGITLVECLVVLGVIVVLIALLLPATRMGSRAALRRVDCTNHLKQIAMALHAYAAEQGAFPPARIVDDAGRPMHSWRTLILPYLGEKPLHDSIDLTKPWDDPANAEALAMAPSVYRCLEADHPENSTCYLASVGPDRALELDRARPLAEIVDPQKSTLLVFEADKDHAVPWMAPDDGDPATFLKVGPESRLLHNNGFNAVFVDGIPRFLRADTPETVRRGLETIAGGDTPEDFYP